MFQTKVSVIIPAYNEEKYISKCLNSLLKQTYDNIELIVVDDGSTDRTREIVRQYEKYGVALLTQNHLGPGTARNKGAEAAKGDILVFVDADMEFDKNYIDELTEPIREKGVIGTSHCSEKVANIDNMVARCWGEEKGFMMDIGYNFVFRAINKKDFMSVGGFDAELGHYDDHSLYFKLGVGAEYAPKAIAYHNNPESFSESFLQARWIGRGYSMRKLGLLKLGLLRYSLSPIILRLLRLSFPLIFLAVYFPLLYLYAFPYVLFVSYPPIIRYYKSKNLKFALTYFVFQFVESIGWLTGYFGKFGGKSNVK